MFFGDRVLVVWIRNAIYSIQENVLHQIFSTYGPIDRLDMFEKEGNHELAVIWFRWSWSAASAKDSLQGCNIYDDCCRIDIEFYSQGMNNSRIDEETTSLDEQSSESKSVIQEHVFREDSDLDESPIKDLESVLNIQPSKEARHRSNIQCKDGHNSLLIRNDKPETTAYIRIKQ